MRNFLCQSLISLCGDPAFVFLTGDLGFQVLEPLRDAAGDRFLNAGLAEQNMVSVAAGLASTGLRPWVYSIAPFLYARPYEQIRNDVCMHHLPVKLVGNGGGYAYGVMGATHHALEDYGALLCLGNIRAFVPAFAADVPPIVGRMVDLAGPSYLRLGRCELPAGYALPAYSSWRRLVEGSAATLVVAGPLAGGILKAILQLPTSKRPSLWVIAELPIQADEVPPDFFQDLQITQRLIVVEEHVVQGSVGQMLSHLLLQMGKPPARFTHRCAVGYPSENYGSQSFHRAECGLTPESIVAELRQ